MVNPSVIWLKQFARK